MRRLDTIALLAIYLAGPPLVAGPAPDGAEPDNEPGSSQSNLVSSCDRSFHQSDDEDWLAFYHQRPTEVTITPGPEVDLTDDGVGTGLVIELHARVGHDAEFVSEMHSQADAAVSVLEFPMLDPGFYFLRVLQCRNTAGCTAAFPPAGAAYCLDFVFDFGIPNPGLLAGFVRDAQTGLPLQLALVETTGNAGTLSHPDGSYALSDGMGSYTATVRAQGYLDASFPFSLVPLATTEVDVDLLPELMFASGFELP